MEITLEKVDLVIERTGVTYAEAKHALEVSNGEVLDAIIYIESIKEADAEANEKIKSESIEDFKEWLKELINKGNVTRIKISKDGKEIVNVPVNAGIAAGVIAIILPPVLAFVLIAAVVTKITVEITMADGSVEVVNKYISKAVDEIKDVATDVADKVKNKVDEVKKDKSNKDEYKIYKKSTINTSDENDNSFTYTVNFDEEE
ncbi:DUF4342 domain-containing protein [Clostridium sartagoforme]|uniref:DUF4342 domain-containing protein n=1 Tax=Clostridium sartagoforme TaxID=84031 RepID=A0A4S2DLZ1_9CLOT|nr:MULTISPECIES: DUF4342 domain-containing protein [Clostridium]MBS5937163.1 DUF4342 domain-containing protein [Clostridium sp.]TGY43326.1 DUF4342 domain-containing protein [Clostridium sartagoforme]